MSTAVIAHWEVTRAKNAGQKPNPHGGQLDKWYIGLKNLDGGEDCGDAYWQRKAPSEVTVGDKVFGKVEEGEFGDRFYLEKEDGYEASTGTSGGSRNVSKGSSSGRDIDASIARQVALKVLSPTLNKEGFDYTRPIVELVEKFILEAGQNADQGAAPLPAGGSPRSGVAPDPPPADKDEHWWLSNLIEQGGASSHASGVLATYALEQLSEENRKKCEALLSHLDTQEEGRKRLEASYVKAVGPVPQKPDLDDDIPF